jgi:uncharacterized protein YecE (DUF72 family)
MGRILIGISSWADRALIESGFYPENVKTPAGRLEYYAENFGLAELDASYHFMPTRNNIALWMDNTPAGFVFDVRAFSLFTNHPTPASSLPKDLQLKAPQDVDHFYIHSLPENLVDQLWQRFAQVILPLSSAQKLGLVVFQFPPWFHYSKENLDYIVRCKERLPEYRLAVEFRTGGWLNDAHREETLKFLRLYGLCLVCVDEPQGLKSSVPPVAEATSPISMIRFHGRNAENWEGKDIEPSERFNYLYSIAELKEWVPKIRAMAEKSDVHLIFKNKHKDFPVKNASQMKQLLE